ncbi:MAG: NAD(P)-dependent dehydrogenase (short-subunit alcohol dehydrogenase family) [Parasphingorhabdus sp.]
MIITSFLYMKNILLITGASRGIGAATARLAVQQNYDICINYRSNAEAASAVLQDVVEAGGSGWLMCADVANEAQVMALYQSVDERGGSLTGLVNNAGILFTQAPLLEMSGERINQVLMTNVTGSLVCAREAVRRMSTKNGGKGGSIVNVSSAASRLGSPNEFIDYASSKGAIDSFTLGLSKEVGGEGIRVNAVRPGLIETDIHAASGEPGRVDRLKVGVPMQRGGSAEEVAESIVWLLSEQSSYVNGAFLDVTGGR